MGDRQTEKVKPETQKLNFLIPTERSHILSTPLNTNPTSCTHTDTPPLPLRNLHWPVTSASPWQLMLFSLLASDLLRSFSRFFCSIFCLKNKFKKRCDPAHVKVNTQWNRVQTRIWLQPSQTFPKLKAIFPKTTQTAVFCFSLFSGLSFLQLLSVNSSPPLLSLKYIM